MQCNTGPKKRVEHDTVSPAYFWRSAPMLISEFEMQVSSPFPLYGLCYMPFYSFILPEWVFQIKPFFVFCHMFGVCPFKFIFTVKKKNTWYFYAGIALNQPTLYKSLKITSGISQQLIIAIMNEMSFFKSIEMLLFYKVKICTHLR